MEWLDGECVKVLLGYSCLLCSTLFYFCSNKMRSWKNVSELTILPTDTLSYYNMLILYNDEMWSQIIKSFVFVV